MSTIHTLETAGEVCPFPLAQAKVAIEEIRSGSQLRISFDCTRRRRQFHAGRPRTATR